MSIDLPRPHAHLPYFLQSWSTLSALDSPCYPESVEPSPHVFEIRPELVVAGPHLVEPRPTLANIYPEVIEFRPTQAELLPGVVESSPKLVDVAQHCSSLAHAPNTSRTRTDFGRICPRNWPISARFRPQVGVAQNLVEAAPKSSSGKFGGQLWLNSPKFAPKFTEFARDRERVGAIWAELDPIQGGPDQSWGPWGASLGRSQPSLGRHRAKLGQVGPDLADSVRCRPGWSPLPSSLKFAATSTKLGRTSGQLGHVVC